MNPTPQQTVRAPHEALNAEDTNRLLEPSHRESSAGGPRGAGKRSDLLLACVERASVTLEPLRLFERGETVVAERTATGASRRPGEPPSRATVTSDFAVSAGLLTSVLRTDDLDGALEIGGTQTSGTL